MKRLNRINAVNGYELEELGIDAVYYEGNEFMYADCNGNDIQAEDLDDEALEIIQSHVDRDGGDEVDE